MDDSEILALYIARSEQAIRETQTKYGWYCTSVAYRILSSIEDMLYFYCTKHNSISIITAN